MTWLFGIVSLLSLFPILLMNLPAYDSKEQDVVDYLLPNGARVNITQDSKSADSTGSSVSLSVPLSSKLLWLIADLD